MQYEIITLAERRLIGPAVRTKNNDPRIRERIGEMWREFITGGRDRIQGKTGDTVYGVYADYESDVNGSFEVMACCEVEVDSPVPEGYRSVQIPAGQYAKFSFTGNAMEGTADFWEAVWSTPLNRRYLCDFEEYPPADDPACAPVNIYIGLAHRP